MPDATEVATTPDATEAPLSEVLATALEADATGEAEATPEETAEAAKKAKQAERIKRADAAEQALQARREAKKEAQWRQDAAKQRAEVEAERKANSDARAQLAEIERAIKTGGPKALEALGIDYAELTNQYLESNSPDSALKATQKRLDDLQARLEAKDKSERDWHEKQQRERQEAYVQQQRTQSLQYALGELEKDAETYQAAYTLPESVLHEWLPKGAEILYKRLGRVPTTQELFAALDVDAQVYHSHIDQRRAQLAQRTKPSDGVTDPRDTGPTATRPQTRTLSNAESSQAATDVDESEEKQLARLKRELRAALSSG